MRPRHPSRLIAVVAALVLAGPALAQEMGTPLANGAPAVQVPFVTLDDERMFAESAYGKALLTALAAEQAVLATENRAIESELARRELELTERRPGLPSAEFRLLADAFNTEVQQHRSVQLAKERAIYERHELARQRYREVANQLLAVVMAERGALAILVEDAILLGFRDLDITDVAIARMDELIGDGAALPTGAEEAQPSGTAPADDPAP